MEGGVEIVVDLGREESKVAEGMAMKKIRAISKQRSELRASLLQLSEVCPFHLANPEDCPLFPLRRMAPEDRLHWVNALSESDLADLVTYHRVCLRIKMESESAKQQTKAPAKTRFRRESGH